MALLLLPWVDSAAKPAKAPPARRLPGRSLAAPMPAIRLHRGSRIQGRPKAVA